MSGLLEYSRILIYGRAVKGISLDTPQADDNKSDNSENVVGSAVLNSKTGAKQLATVYGFEFEGHYYDLPTPAVMLLHGDAQTPQKAGAVVETEPKLTEGIQVWTSDKNDCSMRFDISTGSMESILLEQALDSSAMAAQTSAKRVSGKRVSGKRMSGD